MKSNGVPCGAPNAGGPTNLYSSGDPCAFTYSVPSDTQQIQLLRANPQCTMYSRTIVNCSKPVTGNYGQTRLLPRPRGATTGPPEYVVPSTPPPLGVAPAQRAAAEQLWQQAADLVDRNRYRDAMPLLFKAANMGHARAQSMLGIAFQDGEGVKANDRAAAYWFSAAASQGHRAAQYALGGMYEEGEGGLPKSLARATELYIKIANQGFDKAQLVMGVQYELGEGVPPSRPKAIELLRQAGGEGTELANVLADRNTPARFADAVALGNYLARIRSAQFAASWASARASWGAGSSSGGSTLGAIMYRQWQARGGGGGPRNNGAPPTH